MFSVVRLWLFSLCIWCNTSLDKAWRLNHRTGSNTGLFFSIEVHPLTPRTICSRVTYKQLHMVLIPTLQSSLNSRSCCTGELFLCFYGPWVMNLLQTKVGREYKMKICAYAVIFF
jgi:hypothetical protein